MANVYEIVADNLRKLASDGEKLPWQCPWIKRVPRNAATGKAYRGVNFWLMGMAMRNYGGENRFMTFNQAKQKGLTPKKGSKTHIVIFWTMFEPKGAEKDDKGNVKTIPLLRYSRVFNVSEIEGYDVPNEDSHNTVPLEDAARIIESNSMVKIEVGTDQACYVPATDVVRMPPADTFDSPESHLQVMLHELAHATGHESRLNRKLTPYAMNSESYSNEELVAEMAASMVMATLGYDYTPERSASYIQSWWSQIQKDAKAFVNASSRASDAADMILETCFGIKSEKVSVKKESGAHVA